jgi:hypothetical protein
MVRGSLIIALVLCHAGHVSHGFAQIAHISTTGDHREAQFLIVSAELINFVIQARDFRRHLI